MGSEISFRLNRDELIYMCASVTKATQIYGIKQSEEDVLDEGAKKEKWEGIKSRLIEKQFIISENGSLSVNGALTAVIRIVCEPKLLLIVQRSVNETAGDAAEAPQPDYYYLSSRCAVKLEEENLGADCYLLTFFDEKEELLGDLSEAYSIDEERYGYSPNKVTLPQQLFGEYVKAVSSDAGDKAGKLLMELGFPEECATDLVTAFKNKNHLITLTAVSFDNKEEKEEVVNQTLLFGGDKYLWQVDICGKVYIRGTNGEVFSRKLEVISELFGYF